MYMSHSEGRGPLKGDGDQAGQVWWTGFGVEVKLKPVCVVVQGLGAEG